MVAEAVDFTVEAVVFTVVVEDFMVAEVVGIGDAGFYWITD